MNFSTEPLSRAPRPSWLLPTAFGILICLPLIIGGLRQVASRIVPTVDPISLNTQSNPSEMLHPAISNATISNDHHEAADERDEPTLWIAAYAEDSKPVEEKPTDRTEPVVEKSGEAETKDDDSSQATDQTSEGQGTENHAIVRDAATEFEAWTVALDDDIRKSVVDTITNRLGQTTDQLDQQQSRLERLHVETELYKMQIQHLQNRLKEWKPAETETAAE